MADWSVVPKDEAARTAQVVVPKTSHPAKSPRGHPSANTSVLKMAALFSDIQMRCDHSLKHVEVSCLFSDLPRQELYRIWVHLDLLPAFMRGLIEDAMPEIFAVPWTFPMTDRPVRWEAWTTERVPGEMIAWRSIDGAPYPNHGSVTFSSAGHYAARIGVSVQFDGPNASYINEPTLKSIEAVFRNSIVALRIMARRTPSTKTASVGDTL